MAADLRRMLTDHKDTGFRRISQTAVWRGPHRLVARPVIRGPRIRIKQKTTG